MNDCKCLMHERSSAECTCMCQHDGTDLCDQPVRGPGRPVTCTAIAEDAAWVLECGCRCHQEGPYAVHGRGRACPCGGQRVMAERLGIPHNTFAQADRESDHG